MAARAQSEPALLLQIGAILATGNTAVVEAGNRARRALAALPPAVAAQIAVAESLDTVPDLAAVLFDGDGGDLIALNRQIARRDGPLLQIQLLAAGGDCDLDRLLAEVSTTTNTAAAGGNASLMTIG